MALAAFSAALAVTTAKNTVENHVTSEIVSSIVTSENGLSLDAHDTATVLSKIEAISLAGGLVSIAVGAMQADNLIGGSVKTRIEFSTATASGSDIAMHATSTPTIQTENTVGAVSIGLGAAAAGGGSNTTIDEKISALVNASSLVAAGNVLVDAQATNSANPQLFGLSVGLVGVTAMTSTATIGGQTRAAVSGLSSVQAVSMDVRATDSNSATTSVTVAGSGFFTVQGGKSTVAINRTTVAEVAENAILTLGGTSLGVNAKTTNNASSDAKKVSVALISVAGMGIDTNISSQTLAQLGTNAQLRSSGAVSFDADSKSTAKTNLKNVSIGLGNLDVIFPTATVTQFTAANVLGDVVGMTSNTAAGSLSVRAKSDDDTYVLLNSTEGAALNIGVANATARSGATTQALIGASRTVRVLGNVSLSSSGISEADTEASNLTGGLVNVSIMNAVATSDPQIKSEIGNSAAITAGGGISLHTASPQDLGSQNHTTVRQRDGYSAASAATAGGAVIDVREAGSAVNVWPSAVNRVGTSAQLNAQTISMNASGVVGGTVLTVSGSGGLIAVGGVRAGLSQYPHFVNSIDSGASLSATGDITIRSSRYQ